MKKKKVFVVALLVCLLATISVGTLAWFSAEKTVSNQFYVADSESGSTSNLFNVNVDEYSGDGVYNGAGGYKYLGVLPGDELDKIAKVENTGKYDQYVRVIVTMSDAGVWESMLNNDISRENLLAHFVNFDWTKWNNITAEHDTTNNVIRIVMYYNGILDGSDTANDGPNEVSKVTVFTDVKIPSTMTQEHAEAFGTDGFTIDVKAQAVQTENVVPAGTAAADAAKAAFTTVGMAY